MILYSSDLHESNNKLFNADLEFTLFLLHIFTSKHSACGISQNKEVCCILVVISLC